MKILFLDIDGVLNYEGYQGPTVNGFRGIDPLLVAKLHTIIRETGCQVVLSSTWRLDDWSRKAVREQVVHFMDVTPNFGFPRRAEIRAWLNDNQGKFDNESRAVCLDDNSDCDLAGWGNYLFIQTDAATGLDDEDVARAIEFLGRQ